MSRLQVIIGGAGIKLDILIPDTIRTYQENTKALWLLHDQGGSSTDWLAYSQVELFADEHRVIVVSMSCGDGTCTDWKEGICWESHITKEIWEKVHSMIPMLSERPEDNAICGVGRGGFGAIKFALRYPEKYALGVAFNPDDMLIQDYLAGREIPFGDRIYGSPEKAKNSYDCLETAVTIAGAADRKPEIWIFASQNSKRYSRACELRKLLVKHGYVCRWSESPEAGWKMYNCGIESVLASIDSKGGNMEN